MIRKIILNLLSVFFRLLPRNNKIWITGKISSWEYDNKPPDFFDNSKYFFLYLVNYTNEKVYWLSSSDKEIDTLNLMGLPVVRFPSIKGIYLTLRAKYFFHHYGPDQIDHILQRGSIQLDFWHGTPLKKIRYDICKKPDERHNLYLDFMNKDGKEYIFSTSQYLSKNVLAGAFAVSLDKLLDFGYPRMDILGLSKEENFKFCKKYSSDLIPYINKAQMYSKVFLYMPTFRDDDPNYFEKAAIDFEAMNRVLKNINGVFFLKLHPLTKYLNIKQYENIIQIANDVDIYPFLTYTDYLITDYSSIFFDYLVLNKEIIFIPYDYEHYISNRALYFEYDKITPGIKYYSFSDFIDNIPYVEELDYSVDRKKIKELFIENYNFNACENIYKFFKNK